MVLEQVKLPSLVSQIMPLKPLVHVHFGIPPGEVHVPPFLQ